MTGPDLDIPDFGRLSMKKVKYLNNFYIDYVETIVWIYIGLHIIYF